MSYARHRKQAWATRSTVLRLTTFGAAVTATILLGLAQVDVMGQIGFALTALVTLLAALDSFFNWRSRWVAAEVALAEWHALREDIAFAQANPARNVDDEVVNDWYQRLRDVWKRLSDTWIADRRSG